MKYLGSRSLDSEINIDLTNGKLVFDYSLNKYQVDSIDSNQSEFDFGHNTETDEQLSFLKTIVLKLKHHAMWILYRNKHIRPRIQYLWQDFQIQYDKYFYGVMEQTIEGQHSTITYHIPHNLWFEYELDGEYKEKVKSIELKRRFVKNIHQFGITDQQDGWNFIVNFSDIPMNGKCVIRYL